jgi:hypothetical protein
MPLHPIVTLSPLFCRNGFGYFQRSKGGMLSDGFRLARRAIRQSGSPLFFKISLAVAGILAGSEMLHEGRAHASDQNSLTSPANAATNNSFPPLTEIFQGRTFESTFQRDIFFLREVHDRYPAYWPSLLEANITVDDYIRAPSKLLRFVEELGAALHGKDDITSSTNLALITSSPDFYANTNGYHPEISRAAARALMGIGPSGLKALAASLNEARYRVDPGGMEELIEVIGQTRPESIELVKALTAIAFDFSTTNAAIYPNCTRSAVLNVLRLPGGVASVQERLTADAALDNPGRFQAVVEGIAAAHVGELKSHLQVIDTAVQTRLEGLTNAPGAYRDNLLTLAKTLQHTTGEAKVKSQHTTR